MIKLNSLDALLFGFMKPRAPSLLAAWFFSNGFSPNFEGNRNKGNWNNLFSKWSLVGTGNRNIEHEGHISVWSLLEAAGGINRKCVLTCRSASESVLTGFTGHIFSSLIVKNPWYTHRQVSMIWQIYVMGVLIRHIYISSLSNQRVHPLAVSCATGQISSTIWRLDLNPSKTKSTRSLGSKREDRFPDPFFDVVQNNVWFVLRTRACFASAISVRPHGTFESSQISARW